MDIKKATQELLPRANVVGVGIGYKTKDGKLVRDENGQLIECIVVSVSQKLPVAQLSVEDMVPPQYVGAPTDVVETGAISIINELETTAVNPKLRHRPIVGGLSVGLNPGVTAGTIGLMVRRPNDGNDYILSNWHVLATNNTPVAEREILTVTQPGNFDGGRTPDDVVALLADFVPIQSGLEVPSDCTTASAIAWLPNLFATLVGSNTRLAPVVVQQQVGNLVDAAIGRIIVDFKREIGEIGQVTEVATAELGMKVQKFGRTTEHTTGTITQVSATFTVQGYPGGPAIFTDQVAITGDDGPFLQGGDSGSSLITDDNKVTGLCFAGSDTIGIANRWENVAEALGVNL